MVTWPAATKATSTASDQEAHTEHGVRAVPVTPSLENTSWTEEPEIVAPADLAMRPKSKPGDGDRNRPTR